MSYGKRIGVGYISNRGEYLTIHMLYKILDSTYNWAAYNYAYLL